jgi:endogenous inhibitor of DNA gyrase (YacG/DUF329 family)
MSGGDRGVKWSPFTILAEAMAMTTEIHEAPCPQCGQAVSVTLTTSEIGDQLAAGRTRCPSCGAPLVRAVEGHADQGWRVEDESGA